MKKLKDYFCVLVFGLILFIVVTCISYVSFRNDISRCMPDQNEIFYNQKNVTEYEKKYHQYITSFQNVSEEEYDAYIEASISDGFCNVSIESDKANMFRFKAYTEDRKEYIYLIYEKDTKKMHRIYCRIVLEV